MREKLFSITIKDCRVDTFRSGGKGGQNVDKRDTGVRVVHEPSGAIGESREERSQLANKRTAFTRMGSTGIFQRWAKNQAAKVMGQETVEQRVEKQMEPHNLLIETETADGWNRL